METIKVKIIVAIILLATGTTANAWDSYLFYSMDNSKRDSGYDVENHPFVFNPIGSDNIFGGISVTQTNGTQLTSVNLANYFVPLSNDIHFKKDAGGQEIITDGKKTIEQYPTKLVPFQVYVSPQAAGTGDNVNDISAANKAKLLDPISGYTFRFPFIWTYKGKDSNPCSYTDEKGNFGCAIGFITSISSKNLKTTDGVTQNPTVASFSVGGSFKFPIMQPITAIQDGLIAGAVKLTHSKVSGGGDSAKLFTPVLNASGQPIQFEQSINTYELNFSISLTKQFGISARRIGTIGQNNYFAPQTGITLNANY